MKVSPVSKFFWTVVFLLPFTFAAWYFMGILLTTPVVGGVKLLMTSLFPHAIAGIEQHGYLLNIVTGFSPPNMSQGELVFSLNPLIYGYSMPLYTAILLATPGKEGEKWFHWIVGMLILFVAQLWGVCFDILKTLLFTMGQDIASQMHFDAQWQLDAVALGYQFGYLVLPAVAPIVIWIAFHRPFIATLAPGLAQRLTPPANSD